MRHLSRLVQRGLSFALLFACSTLVSPAAVAADPGAAPRSATPQAVAAPAELPEPLYIPRTGVAPVPTNGEMSEVVFSMGRFYCRPDDPRWRAQTEGGNQVLELMRKVSRFKRVTLYLDPNCRQVLTREDQRNPKLTVVLAYGSMIWPRDSGAFWLRDTQTKKLIAYDTPYMPNRSSIDNFLPVRQAERKGVELLSTGRLDYDLQGGNYQADTDGICFTTHTNRKEKQAVYEKLLKSWGCSHVVFLNSLPGDPSGHLDVAFMLGKDKTAFLSSFSDPMDAEIEAKMMENVKTLEDIGYRVVRIPEPSPERDQKGNIKFYRTYANSLVFENLAFVPSYGLATDKNAAAVFSLSGYRVITSPADKLVELEGALHCASNTVPKR